MKKNTILLALLIGVAVFLMRWFRAFTPIENYQIHFLPLFGVYLGMRLYFKKIISSNPGYEVTFIRAFWLGIQMSFIASLFTGLLCLLLVPYPTETQRMFSPLYLHSFPFISTAAYGVLVTIICSAVYVYFKPAKVKHNTNFKLHTGQFHF
jgi:hypothetical protein